MFQLSQIDTACTDPKAVATWYASLLGLDIKPEGNGYTLRLEGGVLCFPLKEDAGVDPEDRGIHQIRLMSDEPMERLQQRCREAGIPSQSMVIERSAPVLFLTDPEGNPVILESSHTP